MNDTERSLIQQETAQKDWISGGEEKARIKVKKLLLEEAKRRGWDKTKIQIDE
jgi:hypothetical protein